MVAEFVMVDCGWWWCHEWVGFEEREKIER